MTTAHNIDLPAVLAERLTAAHPDVLRELLATFIHTLMGAEADALCGAGYGERSAERTNSRNGTISCYRATALAQEDAMYETLVDIPGWAILAEVGIPTGVILIGGTIVSLRRDRSDRSNDNVFTSAARFIGVSLAFLGAFLVADVWQEEAKWRASASLEFEYAQSVVDHLSVLDPDDARVIRASMHAYATDVLAHERGRRPGGSTDTAAARAITTMDDIITGYQDRPTNKARLAALQRSFVNFQDQGAQRRAVADMVMSPFEVLALAGGGLMAAVIMGFYPAGRSTPAKWLQAIASWLVIIAIVGTPLALESNQVRPNLRARGEPINDFLDRMDHPRQ